MEVNSFINQTKEVYARLADDMSKKIYTNRMLYNLTNDERYLNEIVMEYKPIKEIKDWLDIHENRKKIIFGAGRNGRRIKELFPNEPWLCFVDNNARGVVIDGLKVISLGELVEKPEECAIIISPFKGYKEILLQLKDKKFDEKNIFVFAESIQNTKEYFEDFVPHSEKEVFVDAGVYDGMTTRDFVEWSENDYEQIYMFEPSVDYYERFYTNVKDIKNCSWIKKGLWNEESVLKFFERSDSDIATEMNLNGVLKETVYENGSWIEIPVTSLDVALADKRVTMIKMDIEGSEYNALKGSENIIRTQHPKLIICLYHKLEDIWTLPQLISELNPEYRFYIRHYSINALDTVLYAI